MAIIIISIIGLILYYFYQNIKIPKKQQTNEQSNEQSNEQNWDYKFHHIVYIKPTGKDVSNLSVCDPSIENGDYAYVSNQEFTGLSGIFVIVDAKYMQYAAQNSGECNSTVSEFIASHYADNGWMWSIPNPNFDWYLANNPPHYVTET